MVNPFDRSFFRFLIGFICILVASFGVLYIVGQFTSQTEASSATVSR